MGQRDAEARGGASQVRTGCVLKVAPQSTAGGGLFSKSC